MILPRTRVYNNSAENIFFADNNRFAEDAPSASENDSAKHALAAPNNDITNDLQP